MDYYEALNLLEIKDGYDEDTLKKAYRRKAKQYHPDTTSIKDEDYAEEMMQKINQAHDTLLNQLKNKNSAYSNYNYKRENQSQNKKNNATFIARMKKDLEKYLPVKYIELLNEEPYASYLTIIKNIINDFSKMSLYLDIMITEFFYNYKKNMIISVIEDFIDLFCKLNNIPNKFIINISIFSFDEIYEKLLKVKSKYDIEKTLKNKIEEETEKYKNYNGYNYAKEEI